MNDESTDRLAAVFPADGPSPAPQVEACFQSILEGRLAGMSVLNPALEVKALGFQVLDGRWTGILITPWSMAIMILPAPGDNWARLGDGSQRQFSFPSGSYGFFLTIEESLAAYYLCPLFSPMFKFTDQANAEAIAGEALEALLACEEAGPAEGAPDAAAAGPQARPPEAAPEAAGHTPRTLSRRELFRRGLGLDDGR